MSALGAALKHAPSLELLYLQRCDMTSASLASLIAGMRGHVPRLRRMLLDSNIKALHGLGEVLRAAPALEELHVQNCGLSDASELTAALEDPEVAPKLGELALGANSIAADSLNAARGGRRQAQRPQADERGRPEPRYGRRRWSCGVKTYVEDEERRRRTVG